jgi:hypothetical protein
MCGRSTFLRNSAPLNAGLFLRRSTQRGHAIGIVFGPLPFDALNRSGELFMVKGEIGPAALAGVRCHWRCCAGVRRNSWSRSITIGSPKARLPYHRLKGDTLNQLLSTHILSELPFAHT